MSFEATIIHSFGYAAACVLLFSFQLSNTMLINIDPDFLILNTSLIARSKALFSSLVVVMSNPDSILVLICVYSFQVSNHSNSFPRNVSASLGVLWEVGYSSAVLFFWIQQYLFLNSRQVIIIVSNLDFFSPWHFVYGSV